MYTDLWHNNIIIILAECGHPQDLLPAESNVSVSRIMGPNGFSVEGSSVRFSCPQGWELIGSILAKCTENGEWEPDPSQLVCHYSEG